MVEVLSFLPLASAAVWITIGALQVHVRSYRVWTGAAFIATAFLMGLYALQDGLALVVSLPPTGPGALLPAHFWLVLASLTFFYFAKWLVYGRRWLDALIALPALFMALPYFVPLLPSVGPAFGASPVPFLAGEVLTRYLYYTMAMIVAGLLILRQGASLAFDATSDESWAILAIMVAAALLLAFALLTNPDFGPVLQSAPLFSATLVAPGVLLLLVLRRDQNRGVVQLFNLRQTFQGETLGVYLIYETGDLLGAALGGDDRIDDDVFAGTLDAFQSFFTHALPLLKGRSLKTATFGDIAVVIERGDHCYLTVITTSRRLGLIRDLAKQRLREFEASNVALLEDWSGVVDALRDTEIVLQGFVPEEASGTPDLED
ncbi:MAG: hypothetical protein ACE5I4_07960 [Thermoplasmata archaeon]